jgi:hypothetical protein
MRNIRLLPAAFALAGAAFAFAGCKTAAPEPTAFLPNASEMRTSDLVPFNKIWTRPGSDDMMDEKYTKIMVAPVRTADAFSNRTWMERNNVRAWLDMEKKDISDFALYTQNSFKTALAKSSRLKLADEPGPDTLKLELSLVKVVTGNPLLLIPRDVGSVTPAGLMVSACRRFAGSAVMDTPGQASAALEGVISDSETGEVIATFLDRQKQTSALINFNDLTYYGNLKNISDAWADLFVETIDKKPLVTGKKVSPGLRFKLIDY